MAHIFSQWHTTLNCVLRSYILFVLNTPDVMGTTQTTGANSFMGISPSPLHCGPTANYRSIIIPYNRRRLFACRQITKCKFYRSLSLERSWRTHFTAQITSNVSVCCIFNFQGTQRTFVLPSILGC